MVISVGSVGAGVGWVAVGAVGVVAFVGFVTSIVTGLTSGETDAWLAENAAENWNGAVVTKPVSVEAMHAWRKDHPNAFIAAFAE